jgi:hypothetical protein
MALEFLWVLDALIQIAENFLLKIHILAKYAIVVNARGGRLGTLLTFPRKVF